MDFAAVEQEISDFLSGKINEPNVEVIPLPEDETGFSRPFSKRKVIVEF